MLQITRQSDYAIQLVNRLASLAEGERLSLRQFSNESTISFLFLQKIARLIKRAGIIDSRKGAKGGYVLKKSAKSISFKDIVETIEGPYGVVDCVKNKHLCNKIKHCQGQDAWRKVNNDILKMLENTFIIKDK